MSEPRKLNTGSASGGFDQSQYEAARRRAQEQANQNARRRIIQQPMRTQQQARQIRQQAPVQEPVQEAPQPVQQASVQETPRELTHAQRQAMAYRAAAERKYGNTVQFPTREIQTRRPSQPAQQPAQRTIHRDGTAQQGRPRAQVQQLDVNRVQGSRPAFNYDEAAPAAGGIQMEETPRTHKAHHKDEAAPRTHRANGGRKPPRDGDPAAPKPHGKKSGKGNGGKKKKKKGTWWKILLITLLVIVLIFGGAYALIMGAIAPKGGSIKLNQLVNTPKEFQDKELNVLVTGVDRSSTGDLSAGAANDSNVNDGMTDMILYVHFNNETGELKMLQIPRDTMVTTDTSVSGNYRINGVAKTQGSDNNNNMAALCELVADQYKLPIDGYITIRLEMLTELVDLWTWITRPSARAPALSTPVTRRWTARLWSSCCVPVRSTRMVTSAV